MELLRSHFLKRDWGERSMTACVAPHIANLPLRTLLASKISHSRPQVARWQRLILAANTDASSVGNERPWRFLDHASLICSRIAYRVRSTRSWMPSLFMMRYLWLSTDFCDKCINLATSFTLAPRARCRKTSS